MTLDEKRDRLFSQLREMRLAVIAYSGGIDSSLLLAAAARVMGQNVLAVTAASETYPPEELAHARSFAAALGVRHRVLSTNELQNDDFASNPPDRCYYCKRELFARLRAIADSEGISDVLDGSNADDLRDYRPGRKAAAESGVRSPLAESGLAKSEVRELARALGIPFWNKPSLACLSSRIPYGTRITVPVLRMVHAAENVLRRAGFRQVRVRHHGDIARIELERDDIPVLTGNPGLFDSIARAVKELGYAYVCLDLEGYRTGSMNEMLSRGSMQKAGTTRQETARCVGGS